MLHKREDPRIVLKTTEAIVTLDPDELVWLEASGNYVRLHAGSNDYLMRESLERCLKRLDPKRFRESIAPFA